MTPARRILVTGGAGYIGSHTAKELARSNYEPVTLDDLSEGHRWAVQWGPLIEADLATRDSVGAALEEHRIEAVIHFAASAYVGESVANPRKYFQNNVINTLALLDTMLRHGVRTMVFSSSCATYGIPDKGPITEDQAQHPVSPYGESKLMVERALYWYGQAYGLQWAALRYFNAAGADPDGELGEAHDPETHLIPLVIDAALGRRDCVSIFGTDYDTPDGTAVRDYVHVTDLARAHVGALEHLLNGGSNVSLNLGSGHGSSVTEVVREVERQSGARVPSRAMPRRFGDPPVLVADPSRARRELGWQNELSDLETIVATAFAWHTADKGKT